MEDLAALVAENEEAAAAIAAAYEVLLGGVPNVAGFTFLIENIVATNYGSNNPDVVFNQENAFINVANALVQGNPAALASFQAITAGAASLSDKVAAIYNAMVPTGSQSAEGLAYLTRPDALAFYEQVAAERGVGGPDAAAIVALASILNITYENDTPGIGDSVNDLLAAIADGSAQLPLTGDTLTPIEVADGEGFDGDDYGASTQLTSGTDIFNGSAARDIIEAPVEQTAFFPIQTLNNTDQLNGGGGRDTLVAQLVNAFTIPAKLESIEILTLAGAPGFIVPPVTIDVLNADAIEEINFRAPSNNITVNNVRTTLQSVTITDDVNGNDFTINHTGSGAAGDADALSLTVRNLENGIGGDTDFNTFGYEIYNLVSNGPVGGASYTNDLELNDQAAEEIYLSGNASLEIDGTALNIDHLRIFDARELVGNDPAGDPVFVDAEFYGEGEVDVQGSEGGDYFDFDVDVGSVVTVAGNGGDDWMEFSAGAAATAAGGEGDDTFEFWDDAGVASFDEDDSVDGGNGDNDRLIIRADSGAVLLPNVGPNIVGVERIVHDSGSTTVDITLDASRSGSALELEFSGYYNNNDIVVTNLTNNHVVIISGSGITDVTLDQVVDGVLDNLHLEFVDGADINDDLIVGADIEALDISVGVTAPGDASVITDADQTDTDLRIAGEGDLVIGSSDAYDHDDGLVDASTFTGNLEIYLGTNDQAVIGGSGDDLFVLSDPTFGLLGSDTIDLAVGGADVVRFQTFQFFAEVGLAVPEVFNKILGFDSADDLLEFSQGTFGFDGTQTGNTVVAGANVVQLDYVAGTAINADVATDYNYIKFTTSVFTANGNAEDGFSAAIGLGLIDVDDNNDQFLGTYYDLTNSQVVVFSVDSGGNNQIDQLDDINVIGLIGMTEEQYASFGAGNISFVA